MSSVNSADFDRGALLRRLLSKVSVDNVVGCWNWSDSLSRGYGQLSSKRGMPPFKAHRLAWELLVGQIPDGMVVRHGCDNPKCCNPLHLQIGTQKDNSLDASLRGRLNKKSLLNLRPGAPGFHGAGPKSNKELQNVIR